MKNKQFLKLKQSQSLSPNQLLLVRMIQLPLQELSERIQNEVDENPALEYDDNPKEQQLKDDPELSDEGNYEEQELDLDNFLSSNQDKPAYEYETNNYSEKESYETAFSNDSFGQYMLKELDNLFLNDEDYNLAEFIIGSLDNDGYLREDLQTLIDDFAFTQGIFIEKEKLQAIIKIVQSLDPPGVGAQSLEECLMLQLNRKKNTLNVSLAKEIISNHYTLFSKLHYDTIIEKLSVSKTDFDSALKEIKKLNPKPGNSHSVDSKTNRIIPDFILRIENGNLKIDLNRGNVPELKISPSFKDVLDDYKSDKKKNKVAQREEVQYLKQRLDAAQWFINIITQRYETLQLTITEIVKQQHEYFLTGDESNLKPMILNDIAQKVNLDVSTISRVASSKYIDTPYGIKSLKSLFSEAIISNSGERSSTIEVKKILKEIIEGEDKSHPYVDDKLVELVNEKGFKIARRTVSKYREQLKFPVARLRRK